ncbi:MAG: hypothetical protein HYR71_00125 [Chloroflexi bacterium]|nr:hypothetical protein [Chloroflexota bacterium]
MRRAVLRVALEALIYGVFIIAYLIVVFNFLTQPLVDLNKSNLTGYAVVALGLIIFQSIVLDNVTTFILDRLDI